jgi:hypothetical protein
MQPMHSRDTRRFTARAALLGLALVVAVAATAAAAPGAAGGQRTEQSVSVPVGGLQVAIDPRTGRLRPPTPAEAQALARELARLFQPQTAITSQSVDGTIGMTVGSEYFNFYVARIGAGGGLESACIDGAGAAANFLQGGAAVPEER